MRSGFPNRGTRMIAVTIAACVATEMISARRRMRRSRARCSGLPSTKQPCREPKSFCEWGPGSIDITHLHKKVLRVRTGDFCDAGFLWVAQIPQETGAALAGM